MNCEHSNRILNKYVKRVKSMEDKKSPEMRLKSIPSKYSMKPDMVIARNHEHVETWNRLEEIVQGMKSSAS